MSNDNKEKSSSIKRDAIIAAIGAAALAVALFVKDFIKQLFGFESSGAFHIGHAGSTVFMVFLISFLFWAFLKYVFPNTLGKDIGSTFDKSWKQFSEKHGEWVCIVILLFTALMFRALAAIASGAASG